MYRLKIDSCNRLWALDSGVSRSLEDFEITCPPKILVYDLNTERVVRRFVLLSQIKSDSAIYVEPNSGPFIIEIHESFVLSCVEYECVYNKYLISNFLLIFVYSHAEQIELIFLPKFWEIKHSSPTSLSMRRHRDRKIIATTFTSTSAIQSSPVSRILLSCSSSLLI